MVPLYQKRQGFNPRKAEDFGDGGAFPEIHIAQYPLCMGRKGELQNLIWSSDMILPLTVDAHGNVAFDAIVRQNENATKTVYSSYIDLIPRVLKTDCDDDDESDSDEEELQKEIEETTQSTKAALEKVVNNKLSAAQPKNVVVSQSSGPKYINYRSSQQSKAINSGAKSRQVVHFETRVDPLEPPKFKHKKVPKASGSPPVPIMHSPTRPVTVKNQQDLKIPPCISNWKNPKGYTIPLDKRLAADGRGLQDVQINDHFAKLAESLYVAKEKAREAVAMRSMVLREMVLKENERKEKELLALAQKARLERMGGGAPPPLSVCDGGDEKDMELGRAEREQRLKREKIREERKRERERERRLEAKDAAMGKKSKITRDRDRDISEKVALGMANTRAAGRGGEIMYDTRLFNQEKGMDSGFATDDQYNVYDKGLFTAYDTISTLYNPKKDTDSEMYGGKEKVLKTDRFKPDKEFTGIVERAGPRDNPVEFDESSSEVDLFGLDQFLEDLNQGRKALDEQ